MASEPLRLQYHGIDLVAHGPFVDTTLLMDAARARLADEAVELPLRALIDTGSRNCAIRSGVAESVGFVPYGRATVGSASGESLTALEFLGRLRFSNGAVFACAFYELPLPVDMIIGRDVLAQLKMIYDGPADTVSLDFSA